MMICPNCGSFHEEGDHYCSACGIALAEPKEPAPRRKHTVWPPVLIMLVMMAIGFTVYFLTPSPSDDPVSEGEYPWFEMVDGALYFVEEAYTGSPELVVPETVDGQPVTVLGEDSFADCDSLTTVFLPASLTEIRDGAFRECDALRGILIPGEVMYLGDSVFENCQALEAVCIESIPVSIGTNTFGSCQSVRYIFFKGYSDEWTSLYSEFINPYVYVICQDGIIPQGGEMP